MIKNKSPYYIDTPFVSPSTALTCSQYTLKVYVWNGLKSAVPSTSTYDITKKNPTTSTLTDSVNIARIIKDYLTFVPQEGTVTALINGVNQTWIRTEVYYTTTNTSELTTPQNITNELMVGGYTYGREGRNQSTQSNKVLLDGTEFNVNRGGYFVLPIKINEPVPVTPELVITNVTLNAGTVYDVAFTSAGSYVDYTLLVTPTTGSAYLDTLGLTSPQTTDIGSLTGSMNFKMQGFDSGTGATIFSNTFNITV
tara:strand:- start:338 stop:1096 length:759 start_codon:yes stop_codon:yes gene_type:complete